MGRYRLELKELKSRIVPDPNGDIDTFTEAKKQLAKYFAKMVEKYTRRLFMLSHGSLIDLCPETAKDFDKRFAMNHRQRRQAARAGRPVTKELLQAQEKGLVERIRKAKAGIGGGAQGDVEAKVAAWERELASIQAKLTELTLVEVGSG